MSLGKMWKAIALRVANGERDEARLAEDASRAILDDAEWTERTVRQFVLKRVRDLIATAVKPSGVTSRVPAGQGEFGWLELDPMLAIERLKRQIRLAANAYARAAIHAQVLGMIDASGLEPSDYTAFSDLLRAASVPPELYRALAA